MRKRKMSMMMAIVVFFGAIFVMFIGKKAEAIPTFARQYKTTCMTCHATFPHLTGVGEAFRLNGFKMPGGDELYSKVPPVSMGSPAYKRVFPDAVWPSHIPLIPPVSFRFIGEMTADIGDQSDKSDSRWKIEFPHELEILTAGSFGDDFSFFGEIEWEHEDEFAYEAWLMWEDILLENAFNLKGGSLGADTIALPNTRDHFRFTKSHYLYRDKIIKGLHGPGLEVNGFGRSWKYAVGVVKPQNTYGNANYYAQASFKIGGLGYDGSGGTFEEGGEGLNVSPSGYWRDDSLAFGAFFYNGVDHIDRYGLDARWKYMNLSLAAGWAKAHSKSANEDTDKNVLFAEAYYFVFPWLQPYARYEVFSTDVTSGDQTRLVVGAAVLARANIKLNLEAMFYTKNEPATAAGMDSDVDNRVFLRLDFAF